MSRLVFAVGCVALFAVTGLAQQVEPQPRVLQLQATGDGGFSFSGPIIFSGGGIALGGDDDLGISNDEQFQEEIGLVAEQKEKLVALRKEIQERRDTKFREVQSVGREKAGQLIADFEKQIREDVKKKMSDILLPHQLDRIRQIKVQSQLKNRGVMAVSRGDLADVLGITDEQKTELAEKQKKAERQLREKIDALRKEMQKELLDEVLTAEQRKKLAELAGPDVRPKPLEIATPTASKKDK